MSKAPPTRVLVFASGAVGLKTVAYLLEHFSSNLVGAVSAGVDPALAKLMEGQAASVISWQAERARDCRGLIASLRPDIIVLAWWPYLLKSEDLRLGQSCTLNMHPGYLPHCRGKDPNFWAIVERRPFGVTIHHVDEGIDTGDIAFQRLIEIDWEDTGETLYRRAQDAMNQLFADVCARIVALDVPRSPQAHAQGSFHVRRELDKASEIDLDRLYTGREILDLLRARTFRPHPGAHFGESGQIYDVRVSIEKRSDAVESG